MRLAGGAWCIAALILTNYYSSILTSFITTSSPVPIVNSVQDLANNENIDLIVPKDYGASILISVRFLYLKNIFIWFLIVIVYNKKVNIAGYLKNK